MTSSSNFFDIVLFLLSSLVAGPSCWCQYHHWFWVYDNSCIRDWPEIWKLKILPPEFCPISWDWGELGIPYFGTYVSNKMLLNAAKCHGYSFSCLWFIKGKPTGVKLRLLPRPGIRKSTQKWKIILIWNYFLQCFIGICIKFKTQFLNLITTQWKWFVIIMAV